jgi:hypothetical protein
MEPISNQHIPTGRRSLQAVWLATGLLLLVFFGGQRWEKGKVVDADVVSYYSYLPAAFVYQDMSMHYVVGDTFFQDKVWGVIWKDGFGPVQKYTMGMSAMHLPFFLAGHAAAHLFGYPVDGYSKPYTFALQLSAVFFLFFGLFFLRKVLLRYFSDRVTALVLLLLAFGTNLFYYTAGHAAMPHVALFFLVSLLMHLTIRFYENPSWRLALLLGLTGSLITLIRPNHLLLWLIPALYGIYNQSTLKSRLQFFRKNFRYYLSWPVIGFIVLLPQLFYWQYLTDHWVYYSYGEEGFFWGNPQVWRTLFSFRNGWLIYTPLMALGLIGLVFLRRFAREWTIAVITIFVLGSYVISSWWCWWYGGNFGNRVFIDLYPLLSLGLAATISRLHHVTVQYWQKYALLAVAVLFVALNLFQTLQYTRGLIHYDAMTPAAYRSVIGRLEAPENFESLLAHPDYEQALKGIYD